MPKPCHETLIETVNRTRKKSWLFNLNNSSLFLKKKHLDSFARQYSRIYQNKYGFILQPIYARRHVKHLCSSQEYYLVLDPEKILGYIIQDNDNKASFWLFKKVDGELLSACDYLFPEDPIFNDTCRLIDNNQVFIEFNFDFATIKVTHHAFESFCERIELKSAKTWAINRKVEHLQKLLASSVQVFRLNHVCQLIKYKGEIVRYRTDGSAQWVFVINENGMLKTCYKKTNVYQSGYTQDENYAPY